MSYIDRLKSQLKAVVPCSDYGLSTPHFTKALYKSVRLLLARWSLGLIRDTSGILLDHQASSVMLEQTRAAIESVDDNRITDLHIWSIGPGMYSGTIAVVSDAPKSPEYYKNLISKGLGIVHTIIEVHHFRQ